MIAITLRRTTAVQTRPPTTNTMTCYAAAPALLSTVLMPTATDTLIPHTPGRGDGVGAWPWWESRVVAASTSSRREMSGETRWGWVHRRRPTAASR